MPTHTRKEQKKNLKRNKGGAARQAASAHRPGARGLMGAARRK